MRGEARRSLKECSLRMNVGCESKKEGEQCEIYTRATFIMLQMSLPDTTDIFEFFFKINYKLVQQLLAIYANAHRIITLTIYSRDRWRQVDSLRQKIGTICDVALVYPLL